MSEIIYDYCIHVVNGRSNYVENMINEVLDFLNQKEFQTGEWEVINISYIPTNNCRVFEAIIHYRKNLNRRYSGFPQHVIDATMSATNQTDQTDYFFSGKLSEQNKRLYDIQLPSQVDLLIKERDFYKRMCTMLKIDGYNTMNDDTLK